MENLVTAVTRPGASAVGVTIGLWGAGGFGKATMARLLAHLDEVREHFPDGVVWVTVGEDVVGPELAEKILDAVWLVGGVRPAVTDPVAAGAELGRVLGDRRVLLVVDDVWSAAQVEPFVIGGPGAVRLFTTRIRGVLPDSAELVRVDQMTGSEAAQLLTAGVRGASDGVVSGLVAATGRWPVLLALVNGAVRADQNAGRRAEDSMREILHELGATDPTALDVTDTQERHTAVARTIGVSLTRLTAQQRARYRELAVFGEDVAIPGPALGGGGDRGVVLRCSMPSECAAGRVVTVPWWSQSRHRQTTVSTDAVASMLITSVAGRQTVMECSLGSGDVVEPADRREPGSARGARTPLKPTAGRGLSGAP